MPMTPDDFLLAFAIPNLEDFADRRDDVRLGFNAAVSISHAADHYLEYSRRHSLGRVEQFGEDGNGLLVEYLSRKSGGAFQDVRSVANVYKHLYGDDSSKFGAHSTINSAGAIVRVQLTGDPDLLAIDDNSDPDGHDNSEVIYSVHFTRKDSSQAELLAVLRNALRVVEDLIIC